VGPVDVYIHSKHDVLRKQLVGEVFEHSWQLLAFAAAIGWRIQRRYDPPNSGSTVKIPPSSPRRGDSLLADILAVLMTLEGTADKPGTTDAGKAIQALDGETWNTRCKELAAYAHGGLDYIETVKSAKGCTYSEVVTNLIADGPDPAVVDPLAGL
jgi:hypothetical protein